MRALRNQPVFVVTAILTLALAIGGNTTMFTVIRAVLLKPLAYRDADRLVHISGGATPVRFQEFQSGARSYSELAASSGTESMTLTGSGEPEVLEAARVSYNFLQILGVDPILGRSFTAEEDPPGGPPAVMLSAEIWQRRFAGDSGIVGKAIVLGGAAYNVIGVLPAHFPFPFPGLDLWLTAPAEWSAIAPKSRALSPFLSIFGRLQPGVTLEQAGAELRVLQHQYAIAHPAMLDAKPKAPIRVTPMKESLVASVRSMLWMLSGAVALVLLIACANIASLLLVRGSARSREFAVRAALGAGRGRLIRQLLAESLLLSSIGGAAGVLVSIWCVPALTSLPAFGLPRAGEIHVDLTVLAFAAGLSVVTGVLFGLLPALGASRPHLIEVLRTSGGAADQGKPGWGTGNVLVAGQVALSLILLIGAALLLESMAHLRGAPLGFRPDHLLTVKISLPVARYATDSQRAVFFDDLLARLRATPGIRSASASQFLPMNGGFPGAPVWDAAKPPVRLNERPLAIVSTVTPGYFQTLGIPFLGGRDFDSRDRPNTERVAVIDDGLANALWPGADPVGQRMLIGARLKAQIVGKVRHVHQNVEDSTWPGTVYIAFAQGSPSAAMLAIRTDGDPLRFTNTVRQQVQAIDKDQPLSAIHDMEELVDAEVGQRRLVVTLLGAFAAVAVLLAVVGIYGVMAYAVAQRTHELGIRRALGAQESDIVRMIVGRGFVLASTGVAIGLAGAFALARYIRSELFQVSAFDPVTYVGVAAAFLVVALAACYIPARRGTRIDPMAALRM